MDIVLNKGGSAPQYPLLPLLPVLCIWLSVITRNTGKILRGHVTAIALKILILYFTTQV